MDIIVLIFLARHIGIIAKRKGEKPGPWKLKTVLAFIALEILGVVIGFSISRNIYLALLMGIACAVGGYFLMRYQLDKLPDSSNWDQNIGR
jgi:uncharacterized membrane protein